MRNIDNPNYIEALEDVLLALLHDNPSGIEIRLTLNECEGYPVLQRIFEYMQGVVVNSTGYHYCLSAKRLELRTLLY
jgi:hypothetical protein